MKILHTADWHLGKRLESFNRHKEQEAVLNEICEIADREAVDVVIIAGDLFDTFAPPAESEDLFYNTCKRLTANGLRPVIAIAGNHDAPDRIHAPDVLARLNSIFFIGFPFAHLNPIELDNGIIITKTDAGFMEFQLPRCPYPLRLFLTPYVNESRVKDYLGANTMDSVRETVNIHWAKSAEKYADTEGVNLAVAHLFVMDKDQPPPEEPEEERSILQLGGASAIFTENVPTTWQYVAMGHLHRRQSVKNASCPVVYSGSPLAYSFSEIDQTKYVMIIEAEPAKPVIVRPIELKTGKRLLRGEFDSIDSALLWLVANPDTFVELTILTDSFLKGEDMRRLRQVHAGIVSIKPKPINEKDLKENTVHYVDLERNIDELFMDYFKYRKGVLPNEHLVKLFKNILTVEL